MFTIFWQKSCIRNGKTTSTFNIPMYYYVLMANFHSATLREKRLIKLVTPRPEIEPKSILDTLWWPIILR